MDGIKRILAKVRKRNISVREAYGLLKGLPYENLGFARIDNHRSMRRGFPEVIYAKGKDIEHVVSIAKRIAANHEVLLLTHADEKIYRRLKEVYQDIKFEKSARLVYLDRRKKKKQNGLILIVTGGTSDIPVANEARVTAEIMGNRTKVLTDVGVAGIHRILDKIKILNKARAVIVVAGMEGALASVVSGLTSRPVIAVPTSVGYGASFRGIAPLLTMLNSCSPGVVVCNIDNGFGAGYFAALINR